jgi:hypothetical protein
VRPRTLDNGIARCSQLPLFLSMIDLVLVAGDILWMRLCDNSHGRRSRMGDFIGIRTTRFSETLPILRNSKEGKGGGRFTSVINRVSELTPYFTECNFS